MTLIVTGAFGGIGSAVCTELAGMGYHVIRAVRHLPPEPDSTRGAMRTDVAADLASPGGWDRIVETAVSADRTIVGLVHCAGALVPRNFAEMSPDDLKKMIDDNLLGLMLGFRALLPGMIERRRGHLIVVGSLGGIIPMPGGSVYASMKFGVRGFALSMAEELRGSGVSVSLLSCGPVETPMLRAEAQRELPITFIHRPIPPSSVASAVAALLVRPRREMVIPRTSALLAPLVGGFASLFSGIYPLVSAVGRAGELRYRRTLAEHPVIPGDR